MHNDESSLGRLALNGAGLESHSREQWLAGIVERVGAGRTQVVWLERAVRSQSYRVPALQVGAAIVTEHLADGCLEMELSYRL